MGSEQEAARFGPGKVRISPKPHHDLPPRRCCCSIRFGNSRSCATTTLVVEFLARLTQRADLGQGKREHSHDREQETADELNLGGAEQCGNGRYRDLT